MKRKKLVCDVEVESEDVFGDSLVMLTGQKRRTYVLVDPKCLHCVDDYETREYEKKSAEEEIAFERGELYFDEKRVDSVRKYLKRLRSSDFGYVCDEIKNLHAAKNADYGDAFGKMYAKYGMVYAMAHLEEKLSRIERLSKNKNKVNSEGIEDSLKDLASYAIMTLLEIRKANETKSKELNRL